MDGAISGECLTVSLARMAHDPIQLAGLYEILGQYCHQSRNFLHAIKLSIFLARRGDATGDPVVWEELERSYLSVEHLFDRLQLICRPMSVAPVRLPLTLLIEDRLATWRGWMAMREGELESIPPGSPAVGDFDPARMALGLDAFVSWRGDVGERGGTAVLKWGAEGDHFFLDWREPEARDLGPTGDLHEPSDRLALPLLARVASAHAGTLDYDFRDGLRVRLRWPLEALRPERATP